MSDSTNTSEPAIERPTWRFSGRRGTPVHLREQAPATLPREIRQVISEMARERSGERPARSSARAGVSLARPDASPAPPVAAAPQPVERRAARQDEVPVSVTSTHVPPVAAPSTTEDTTSESQEAAQSLTAKASESASQPKRRSRNRSARARAKARAKAKAKAREEHSMLAGDVEIKIEAAPEPPPAQVEPRADEPAGVNEPETVTPELPPAISAVETGRQAAWELGRLPILIDATVVPRSAESTEGAAAPTIEPPDEQRPDEQLPEPIADAAPETVALPEPDPAVPAPAPEPVARWTGAAPRRARTKKHQPVELRPIEWAPVGRNPKPVPYDDLALPATETPKSIERLGADLRAREIGQVASDERPPLAPAARTAAARHRVGRRLDDLAGIVKQLEALSPR